MGSGGRVVAAVVVLCCLVGIGVLATPAAADGPAGMEGDGTEGDPYEITNATQLQAMAEELDAHYVLTEDVDASGTAAWNDGAGFDPVGEDGAEFTGTLDGDGHSISDLTISSVGEPAGLFAILFPGSRVSNLSLSNASVTGGQPTMGLVAANGHGGTIENVHVTGTSSSVGIYLGGLVGWSRNSHVRNSTADVSLEGDGDTTIGGLVGRNSAKVSTSFATGHVANGGTVGGLVGEDDGGTVDDSYWDINETGLETSAGAETGLTTEDMTGPNATEHMDGLDYGTTWLVLDRTDAYPVLGWWDDSYDPSPDNEIGDSDEPTVVDVGVESATPTVGETVTATVTVENRGEDATAYDGPLDIEGESVTAESVAVEGGETASYAVTYAFERAGEYTLSAGSESVTVTVTDGGDGDGSTGDDADGPEDDGDESTSGDDGAAGSSDGDGPDGEDGDTLSGFGVLVALLAVLGGALVANRGA